MGHNEQKPSTEPLRAVVYVRISDDPEGTERGVDRQEADCRAYGLTPFRRSGGSESRPVARGFGQGDWSDHVEQ